MKPDEQNRAIAEWCGLKVVAGTGLYEGQLVIKTWQGPDDIYKLGDDATFDAAMESVYRLPNYHGDLNAVHEAESRMSPHLRNDYIATLWKVTGNEVSSHNFWTEYDFRAFYSCLHATAPQRCEALLRTIEKWID